MRAVRGRPKSPNRKLLVSVRYSPEVVAYFKSTGEGWQSRMDSVLLKYVEKHSRPVAREMGPTPSVKGTHLRQAAIRPRPLLQTLIWPRYPTHSKHLYAPQPRCSLDPSP